MTPHFHGTARGQEYLDTTVHTASPARLRLMLIERGVEVAARLGEIWRSGAQPPFANEQSLRLLEILNELLSGVTSDQYEVCRKVADLYVFLVQHLIAAEEIGNADAADEIRLVLETEAETWRLVCMNEALAHHPLTDFFAPPHEPHGQASGGGLNLQA